MFIVESYHLAIIFCFITMLCWGSWANTQKLVTSRWRFELFYWDYVIGILLFSLLAALTLGSTGDKGRSFIDDLQQASAGNLASAFTGGIIFNLANILLTAAIAIAGMSVAFPIGIGLALILGVIINYISVQKGDPLLLFAGVLFVALAIILNAVAYKKVSVSQQKPGTKGILLSIVAGLLMSFFYRFIAAAMDINNFESPAPEKLTPYTAVFVFAIGIFVSNFVFNTILMRKPIEGVPLSYSQYFKGRFPLHLAGLAGGSIWALGNIFNLIAAEKAGPAISYGLGQGATFIAALWGVFVWKEFKNADKKVYTLVTLMFVFFLTGLILLIMSGR